MKILLFLFAITLSYTAQAQNINELYHAKGIVRANAVVCNPNGEYINTGNAPIDFITHEYVAKVNPNGDTAWVRPFNLTGNQKAGDEAFTITRLNNGNCVIGSFSGNPAPTGQSAADLTWVSDNGVILKTTKYTSDTNSQRCYSIKERKNGNIVFTGLRYKRGDTLTNTVGDADILMVGTDSNGNQLWESVFGTSNDDVMNSMDTTVGKGYILGGYSGNYMCMAKTDSLGKKIWQKTYPNFMGNNLNSNGNTVLTAKDGGYFLAGDLAYTDGTVNGYIIKTDSGGVIQWQKQYRGVSIESYFEGMKQLPNGDLLVSGSQEQDPNLNRYFGWLVKLDVNGNLLWQHTYNYYTQDSTGHYIYSMDVTPDKGVIMAGMVIDFRHRPAYSNQVWLVKTDSLGNSVTNGIQQNGKLIPFATLALSPNPSTTNSTLSYQLAEPTPANLTISDINGKVLKTYTLPTTDKGQITLDATQYAEGIYFCKLMVQGQPQQVVKWVVAK